MRISHESIFSSSIRSFCISFFAILGICLSFLLVFLFLGGIFGAGKEGVALEYSYEVLPDANYQRELLAFHSPVILQIDIQGIIGLEEMTGDKIRRQLIESREGLIKGGRVKGILLNINTPGGVVSDADAIYRAIIEYKEKFNIPVYAYVDGYCASGGMYIACAADKIYATDVSVIGSIGVYSQFFNVSDLMNKIGVQSLMVLEGKEKGALNPFTTWKPGEADDVVALTKYLYSSFVDIVAHHRPKLTRELLIETYGAKVFSAPDSLEYGYIDVAGASWTEVLKDLVQAAGLPAGESYQVMSLKAQKWFGGLFDASATWMSKECVHRMELPSGMDVRLANRPLYLYQP